LFDCCIREELKKKGKKRENVLEIEGIVELLHHRITHPLQLTFGKFYRVKAHIAQKKRHSPKSSKSRLQRPIGLVFKMLYASFSLTASVKLFFWIGAVEEVSKFSSVSWYNS
jgi:hypothetical protein